VDLLKCPKCGFKVIVGASATLLLVCPKCGSELEYEYIPRREVIVDPFAYALWTTNFAFCDASTYAQENYY